MSHILRPLEGKSGMVMDGALGLAGSAGGVNQHEGIHALHRLGAEVICGVAALNRLVPVDYSLGLEIRIHPANGDDALDASCDLRCLARNPAQRHGLAATVKSVGRNQQLGV